MHIYLLIYVSLIESIIMISGQTKVAEMNVKIKGKKGKKIKIYMKPSPQWHKEV